MINFEDSSKLREFNEEMKKFLIDKKGTVVISKETVN